MNWLEILGWNQKQINDLRYTAYSYANQGIYEVALKCYDALSVLSPIPADLQMLGALHLQMGNGEKALENLDRALQMVPTDPQTQLNRAKALFMLGNKRQGLMQAIELEKSTDKMISSQAAALLLAYK